MAHVINQDCKVRLLSSYDGTPFYDAEEGEEVTQVSGLGTETMRVTFENGDVGEIHEDLLTEIY